MSENLTREILGLRRECPDHPWPLPKPSCPICARNGGLVHAARLAKDAHCAACECIHEPCGYVIGSMGCDESHDREGASSPEPTPHVCQMCERPLDGHWWRCVNPSGYAVELGGELFTQAQWEAVQVYAKGTSATTKQVDSRCRCSHARGVHANGPCSACPCSWWGQE